jgi:hypothetical protein
LLFAAKLSASDLSFLEEILGSRQSGEPKNSQPPRCSFAVFRCSCADYMAGTLNRHDNLSRSR